MSIFVNSDTKIALLSGAPFDDPSWNFMSNDAIVDTVAMVNQLAGTRRMLGHHVITPGQAGWMEAVDAAIEKGARMDGWKAYTIGDPLSASTEHPYRLDDEELMYPFYEKALKAGKRNIAIHKGLMPADYETSWAGKWMYNTPWDVAKAATRGVFPFGFGWEPAACPISEGHRGVPTHVYDRVIGMPSVFGVGSVDCPPVRTIHAAPPGRFLGAECVFNSA